MGKGLKIGRGQIGANMACIGTQIGRPGQLGCGFGHMARVGNQTDSKGVRIVSSRMGKAEERLKDELERDSLFASRRDKVLQVTLPRFSWTDERGWPK